MFFVPVWPGLLNVYSVWREHAFLDIATSRSQLVLWIAMSSSVPLPGSQCIISMSRNKKIKIKRTLRGFEWTFELTWTDNIGYISRYPISLISTAVSHTISHTHAATCVTKNYNISYSLCIWCDTRTRSRHSVSVCDLQWSIDCVVLCCVVCTGGETNQRVYEANNTSSPVAS